jgi:hypothetical protein
VELTESTPKNPDCKARDNRPCTSADVRRRPWRLAPLLAPQRLPGAGHTIGRADSEKREAVSDIECPPYEPAGPVAQRDPLSAGYALLESTPRSVVPREQASRSGARPAGLVFRLR